MLAIVASCIPNRGPYEAKTPCVFFKSDIRIIEPNPCDGWHSPIKNAIIRT